MTFLKKLKDMKTKSKDEEERCKGLFFRGTTNNYLSSHKSIEVRKSLRLLKTKSCKGCGHCEWIWEYIEEEISDGSFNDYLQDIDCDKIYTIKTVWHPGTYEYPQEGEMEISFIEVNK